MKQNIEIEVPDGMKAIYTDGKIEFVKEEPVRSKSWKGFCKNHPDFKGEYVILTGVPAKITKPEYMGYKTRSSCMFTDFLATKEDAEGILALIQLTRLHDEWVGDWKPEWWNNCQNKYCIIFVGKGFHILAKYTEYHFLSFPTIEMADEFLECFKDLLETAKRFI